MFERYTEKARRVIFFARYEASQYGSPYIETEHLLLGLLREDRALAARFLGGTKVEPEIRADIEQQIIHRERIDTSVEMPLTAESMRILNFAAEEAERLGHGHVGTEHLLLGMLRMEGSLAAQVLQKRGLKLDQIREQLPTSATIPTVKASPSDTALPKLASFLAGLKWHKAEDLLPFFAANAQFVDVHGRQWNRKEIEKEFVTLLAPYAKKNAEHIIEQTLVDSSEVVVALVLCKNAILASMERIWIHRLSIVLIQEHDDWAIVLIQVTPVQPA
ncbi:MAG TPA: Clp protease N-terminal domain-containing protein [Candidatus Acidoferrum sp.]|nr:Clp protease N-terminal domain-containing protein [Candidatus Acidoferrum sp.]